MQLSLVLLLDQKKSTLMSKIKKIKILHILHSVGGVNIYARQITDNINPENIENVIVSQPLTSDQSFYDAKGNLLKCYSTTIGREINPLYDLLALIKCIYVIFFEKPDLIHAHSSKGGVLARVAALFFNTKVLYTPHAFSFLSTKNYFKKKMYILIEKALKTKNTFLLATSNSEKARAIKTVGFSPSKVLVLNNAINPINFKELNPNQIHPNYICTIARPSYQKNLEMLLEVFLLVSNTHKEIHLYIIGAGEHSPSLNKISQIISDYSLEDRITILPWVPRKRALSILKNSKIYISTSRYEGMPFSVIESMSLKVPCVLTDTDGNRDLVVDGFNGYIIKNMNIDQMSTKISTLLGNNLKRKKLAENAYAYYKKNHLLSNFINKLTGHYIKFSKS